MPLQVLIQLLLIILMRPGSSVRLTFALMNPEKSSFSNLFSEATIDPVFEKTQPFCPAVNVSMTTRRHVNKPLFKSMSQTLWCSSVISTLLFFLSPPNPLCVVMTAVLRLDSSLAKERIDGGKGKEMA